MKYQTKPIEVDAVQWFKNGDDPRVVEGKMFKWLPIMPSNWIVYYPNADVTNVYSDERFRELFDKQEEYYSDREHSIDNFPKRIYERGSGTFTFEKDDSVPMW